MDSGGCSMQITWSSGDIPLGIGGASMVLCRFVIMETYSELGEYLGASQGRFPIRLPGQAGHHGYVTYVFDPHETPGAHAIILADGPGSGLRIFGRSWCRVGRKYHFQCTCGVHIEEETERDM